MPNKIKDTQPLSPTSEFLWLWEFCQKYNYDKTLKVLEDLSHRQTNDFNSLVGFKIYNVSSLDKLWRCETLPKQILGENKMEQYTLSFYGAVKTRDDILNDKITIVHKNNIFYVHPGQTRYLLNVLCQDVSLGATVVDYDLNDDKIKNTFKNAEFSDGNFEYDLKGNSEGYFKLLFDVGYDKDIAYGWQIGYETTKFYDEVVPNSDHSVKIFLDKRQLISYDNEKPEMNVYVDDIYGWARFIIDYYCERKLTYNGYQTDI